MMNHQIDPHWRAGRAALLGAVRGLCGSEKLADVALVVRGARMPAHRAVLAPHSRVFARMWACAMAEGAPGAEVAIPDLAPETVAQLLQYCYGRLAALPASHAEVRERCFSKYMPAPRDLKETRPLSCIPAPASRTPKALL
jgi:hypothetical protein